MVQNIIKLSERENRIVNMTKAKYGMKNKNQALGFIIQTFAKNFMPEALEPIEKPRRSEGIKLQSLDALRKELEGEKTNG
ncbi:MAG: DUF2683 family protein [Candidatus Pacearchaeota archaeon]